MAVECAGVKGFARARYRQFQSIDSLSSLHTAIEADAIVGNRQVLHEAARPGKRANLWASADRFQSSSAPDNGTSIVKPGERGALVEGDMVRLAALDLVLWSVGARMVGVAFDLEIASTYADDRATDAPRLGIPAHAIMDLEALRHVRSIRCRRRTVKQAVLALNI